MKIKQIDVNTSSHLPDWC